MPQTRIQPPQVFEVLFWRTTMPMHWLAYDPVDPPDLAGQADPLSDPMFCSDRGSHEAFR
ncbi:MAG: hypothetical protein EBT56_16315 [Betaproteobacteria bacterium]|nr:hypothetical protein [Betaproteobacteria bacterium]